MIIRHAKWIILKAALLCLNYQQLLGSILTSIHLMARFVFPKIIQARSLILSFSCFVGNPCFTFLARELNHTWSHSSKSYRKGNFKTFASLSMKVFVISFQVTSYCSHRRSHAISGHGFPPLNKCCMFGSQSVRKHVEILP